MLSRRRSPSALYSDEEWMLRRSRIAMLRIYTLSFIVIALLFAFVCSSVYDMYMFACAGGEGLEYHDFASLKALNPDVIAWVKMDGTNVDYPVVQGRDNFEYLDKDYKGETYAGGAIFLDAENSADFGDCYNILHGHHMAYGAMFGNLGEYLKEDFFKNNRTGTLLTEDSEYALRVAGAGIFDAYNLEVYSVQNRSEIPSHLLEKCSLRRPVRIGKDERMLLLSTCSGDMSNDRIVVFCIMKYVGRNAE